MSLDQHSDEIQTKVYLFGRPADGTEPLLPNGLDLACFQSVPSLSALPLYMGPAGGDTNDLETQGWCIVYPDSARGHLARKALTPLVTHRKEGGRVPILELRYPSDVWPSSEQWCDRSGLSNAVEKRPYYVLLVGDFDEIPLEIQQCLMRWKAVGRLAFDASDEYAAYAHKVRSCENPEARRGNHTLLCCVDDGSRAPEWAATELAAPCSRLLRSHRGGEVAVNRMSSSRELLNAARDADAGVLFTASHGQIRPKDSDWPSRDELRRRQGALCFQRPHVLEGGCVANGAFLRGGFWFMLACFGAGTPVESSYAPWINALSPTLLSEGYRKSLLAALPRPGEGPFVAALPKAALANPEGPIAVCGHVDIAWTFAWSYAFANTLTGPSRPERLAGLLLDACRSHRIGHAVQHISEELSRVDHDLSKLTGVAGRPRMQPGVTRDLLIARYLINRYDLSNYILLGDPAARIPRADVPA